MLSINATGRNSAPLVGGLDNCRIISLQSCRKVRNYSQTPTYIQKIELFLEKKKKTKKRVARKCLFYKNTNIFRLEAQTKCSHCFDSFAKFQMFSRYISTKSHFLINLYNNLSRCRVR